jgi:hypothetical protein
MITLYIDQYGNKYFASTVKELRSKIGNGGSKVSKMYIDGKGFETYHVGYVIGRYWLRAYKPLLIKQK